MGHRDDFEKVYKALPDNEWEKISLVCSNHECSNCKHSMTCATFKHRRKFLSTDNELIITNHNQLIQSYLNSQSGKSYILPPSPGTIIIDEAHDFLDNFLGQIKDSIDYKNLNNLKNKVCNKHKLAYRNSISKMHHIINNNKKNLESIQGRFKIDEDIVNLFIQIREYINESLVIYVSQSINYTSGNNENIQNEFSSALEIIDNILSVDNVSWISYEEEGFYSISKKFIEKFSKFIKQLSYNNKIIFMSGTLATDDNFDFIINLWKLDKNLIEMKIYNTPFYYDHQAIMYVPTGLINAKRENNQEYVDNQVKKMKELLCLTNGKSLILSTSKMHMRSIFTGLLDFLTQKNINLFLQGAASVESLSERFKNDVDSVLIGSGSFFSGISVKGESLISVILTKLPFAVPDDPFFELLSEGYNEKEKFDFITMPNMLIKLKQAVGRLIRDITDYGVISILDKRIFDSGYGTIIQTTFKKLGYKITRDFNDVTIFFNSIKSNADRFIYPTYSHDSIIISETIKKENMPPRKTYKDKQKYYKYYGRLVPLSDYKLNTDTDIAEGQSNFALSILKEYNIKSTKLSTISNLYDINYLKSNFPFINDEQRKIFTKYKGSKSIKCRKSPLKQYILTEEELARLRNN